MPNALGIACRVRGALARLCVGMLLFTDRVEMTANVLVHLEHVHLVLSENGKHSVVAANLSLVARVL